MRQQYQNHFKGRGGTHPETKNTPPPPPPLAAAPADLGELRPELLFSQTSPSIYFVEAGSYKASKTGSAVAVTASDLWTNCHVVEGSENIVLSDGTSRWPVTRVAGDSVTDRCVLRSGTPVRPIAGIRSYGTLRVGEHVYTIGNPSGLQRTLGDGLISGLRERDGVRLIQTTAPISPGSSGGSLVDNQGRLVGITTFYIGSTGSLNFAISADEYANLFPSGKR